LKKIVLYAMATAIAFALPASGWAQQQDLEVTISVVPADAAADAATKVIKLPDAATDQRRESSAFGLGVANKARAMRGELGREFGKEVSEAAKQRAQTRGPGIPPGKP
jgi:hypothetical protein